MANPVTPDGKDGLPDYRKAVTRADLIRALRDMTAIVERAHVKCELLDEEDCEAEQYGDGNVGEHPALRNAQLLVFLTETK